MILLALLSLFFFVGLGHVHLFDWDEINFAESAREMIESDNYLRVQINYQAFWEKPPFFFWLQVASMKLFGINEFAARFPNAVFGFLYLITFYLIGRKHYNGRFGLIWALCFFGSLLPHLYFKSGIIDPVFNYFIFLSVYFMIRVINSPNKEKLVQFAILSGVFSGLSVITKGPVGFLLLGLTLLGYLVAKRFKPFPSIKSILLFFLGFAVIISAWLSMEVYQNGFDVLGKFIAYQIELFNSPVAGHEQPFYYHFVVVFLGCFPMSVLALPQFWASYDDAPLNLKKWMLSLFWVVLILFSIVTTKIIHYSSMTYAPLSFLAALSIYKMASEGFIRNLIKVILPIIGIVIGIAITAVPIVVYNKEALYSSINDPFAVASLKYAVQWSGMEFLVGVFFILALLVSIIYLFRGKIYSFLIIQTCNLAITLLLVQYTILPKIEQFTQGPMIEFCKSLQGKDYYVETYGFKSYAHYYYGRVPYGLSEKRLDQQWLLNGDVDKSVYMISKITNNELNDHPNFELIETRGGFNFYLRKLP